MKQTIVNAMIEFQSTPEGKAALIGIYGIEGLLPCRDEDYNSLRQMLKAQGMDVEELVRKTKK
jgi:ABC-type phosphate/phosphonate transport system substrate-binding protein